MSRTTRADDGIATTDYPAADDVRPVSTSDAQSIQASGAYRAMLDDALEAMGDSDLADADPKAARSARDSGVTVLKVQTIAEAEAVAEAATYVLNGGARDDELTEPQADALARVKSEAERLAVAFTPAAHGLTTSHADDDDDAADDADDDPVIMTDGGRVQSPKYPAAAVELAHRRFHADVTDVELFPDDAKVCMYTDGGVVAIDAAKAVEDALGARRTTILGSHKGGTTGACVVFRGVDL